MASARTVSAGDFEIRFFWDGDVLVATVEGRHDSFEISLAYWKLIADERVARSARRVLVLENLEESGEPGIGFGLFEHLVELDFRGVKLAFVDCIDAHRSAHEQMAIMAREHGILAGIFGDKGQALTWLRHGEE